jgi:glycosyltransferase involved in cell wall biosynthesis
MKVAIITAAYKEPEDYLAECIDSVRNQTYPNILHIVVNDGADPYTIEGTQVINLPHNFGDMGDTPRAIGAVAAIGQGADAICWLDYDNWYEPTHIESLVRLMEDMQADIACSTRNLYSMDGYLLGPCYEINGIDFVDCNCYLVGRGAFHLTWKWTEIPAGKHHIDDRFVWTEIRRMIKEDHMRVVYSGQPTVGYRSNYRNHYFHYGFQPPPTAK